MNHLAMQQLPYCCGFNVLGGFNHFTMDQPGAAKYRDDLAADIDEAIRKSGGNSGIIVTLNDYQRSSDPLRRLLWDKGFRRKGMANNYENSGNDVYLYVRLNDHGEIRWR